MTVNDHLFHATMKREYLEKATSGKFVMHEHNAGLGGSGMRCPKQEPVNTFVYNKERAQRVTIDGIAYQMPAFSILPLVSNQHFEFENPAELVAWQFNREFYCIVDHDAEVGCVGFLFYGIHHPMFVTLGSREIEEMKLIERMFSEEWQLDDHFRGEMLRTLLKRLIIKTTRVAKRQCEGYRELPDEKMEVVRKFALLLEIHFRRRHDVKFYAAELNKSPKTLSNLFGILHQPAPSRIIQERIILEAKRYMHYTDKTAKEIAYELGFESPAHFSRFFKSRTGHNIMQFKKGDRTPVEGI